MQIWLIDDDEIEHILVEGLLKRLTSNPALRYFSNAEPALEVLQGMAAAAAPDLILLDLSMPGLDGFDFLARYQEFELGKKFEDCMLYILSSSASTHDREKSLAYPFVKGYLLKPLLMIQLQALMQEIEAPLEA